ncbi:MAG: sigma-70 family RNA polymerase sigma factor [Kiritimatiellae bacterium]|nr:sigma-70 family RNA polymerase sigma factor [Kiritimatiellia bacterium]
MDSTETQAVRSAQQGDAKAFEQLVRSYQGRIRAWFATHMADASQVDDFAQDVFLIAFQRLGSFDPLRPFYPWLKGIAVNVLRNERRKMRPAVLDGEQELETLLDGFAAEQGERLEDELAGRDVFRALHECIAKLKAASSRIVQAYYMANLPLQDIGRREGKSSKAISVTLVRIRRRLRACLTARLGEAEFVG